MRGTLIKFKWSWALGGIKIKTSYFWVTKEDGYYARLRINMDWLMGKVQPWVMTAYDGDPDTYTSRKTLKLIKIYRIESEDIKL